ncbi:branched-chain amino acid aminotransferase [Pontibacillus yanchengensis]|uniref:Branched-chain amino acid aminotransferase n=2 Tax=Pontibacillus yanchengensis TaxID=462910 RepID=A0ACC7VCX7_9BACI|nr:branched-chain amino acid aminotransferase [Pontibacillus yanchengensis]MYL32181.1 branched-chain amino acid aminotransferase [Pontibacillus yanchengensis]MYL52761.1 branched-chain amino acid aminotransferase [Pontibacillus yanchengensis]
MSQHISFVQREELKNKPASDALGFGVHYTDHMFVMDYEEEQGWHDPRIVPYGPLTMDPAAMVFHYGQAIFEGLKAYTTPEGTVQLFRPDRNMKRFNQSCERLHIPKIDEDFLLNAIQQLLLTDKDWIPNQEGTSLYIRPYVFATEPFIGVRPSKQYKLLVILSPVGSYYGDQLSPVPIYVEEKYIRASVGGVGEVKTAGNYAASMKAQKEAEAKGYSQILWLDSKENKYVEEVGSMNIFFKINGEVVTPALSGSILNGVTRNSVIELLNHWGIPVREEKISIQEIFDAHERGELEEVFGAGTAVVISPVGELTWNDQTIQVNDKNIGSLSQRLYDTITGIQFGKIEDEFNWTVQVDEVKV